MFDLTLTWAEFLVLLDATLATTVVGMDARTLIPASADEYQALIEQGLRLFARRGLLHVDDDGVRILDRTLYTMATVLAHPQIAVITSRDTSGSGKPLSLHYFGDQGIVKQTFPQPGEHRIAALPALPALFDRVLDSLPVQRAAEVDTAITLPQETFVSVKTLAKGGQRTAAVDLLSQSGLAVPAADLFVKALLQPTFSGNVALLRCEDQEITDVREVLLLQGPRAAWLIIHNRSRAATSTIESVSAGMFKERLIGWFDELALAYSVGLCNA